MTLTRKIWTSKKGVNALDYIGDEGEIFYQSGVVELRFSDGHTPGGIPFYTGGGNGGGGYTTFFSNLAERDSVVPTQGQLAFVSDDGTGTNRLYLAVQTTPNVIWANVSIDSNLSTINSGQAKQSFDSTLNFSFNYQTSTQTFLGTLAADRIITNIEVRINTPFDDPSSTMTIGTVNNPSEFFPVELSDLNAEDTYANPQQYYLNSQTSIELFLNTGSSTVGAGYVDITYQ